MSGCRSWLRTLAVALLIGLRCDLAPADEGDHPLLTRHPGSTVTKQEVEDFGRYSLIVGKPTKGMDFEAKKIEGTLTRIVYQNPTDRSTLEIFRNYDQALQGAGAESLYRCELDDCGPAYARSAWNQFNGLFAASDGDPRYLAARVENEGIQTYVAVMVGKRRTQVDVIEVKGMDVGLVHVDAQALTQGIERDGMVRVYGIHFDFDKSDMRSQSKPALDAIAEMLRAKPDLSVFIVGHTDSKGSLTHNPELSKARARAVVGKLTAEYGIAAARLDPHGVASLAPVATNTTEEGRQLNRRVELVAR